MKKYDAKEIAKNAIMLLQKELDSSEEFCALNIPTKDEEKLNESLKTVLEFLRDCNEDYLEEIDAEYPEFKAAI